MFCTAVVQIIVGEGESSKTPDKPFAAPNASANLSIGPPKAALVAALHVNWTLLTRPPVLAIVTPIGGIVRRGIWTFILFLLTAVVCVSAIPQTDLPETSYNESDTPVNQSTPVVLGIRFVRPARTLIVLPKRALQEEWNFRVPANDGLSASISVRLDSHSLQNLLCTLLI